MAIPARNEAGNVADCLASIDRAAARCDVVVAADACRDGTAAIARKVSTSHTRVDVIEGGWHGAGRARAAAVDWARAASAGLDLSTVWIAKTHADCVVQPRWLHRQLRDANTGSHAVAGVVTLDPRTTPDTCWRASPPRTTFRAPPTVTFTAPTSACAPNRYIRGQIDASTS